MWRIGTCSFNYPSWKGLVYRGDDPKLYLTEYAVKYNSVEIDRWFWSLFDPEKEPKLPESQTAREYSEAVDKDFAFSLKMPNSLTLTHSYKKGKIPSKPNPNFLSVSLFQKILERLQPILGKTAVLMFQFGYLNKSMSASASWFFDQWQRFSQALQSPVPLAMEIRNPNYLTREYFALLKATDTAHVFLQGYYMPDILSYADRFELPPSLVLRLHGPDREGIEEETGEQWNRIVRPHDEQLAQVAEHLKTWRREGKSLLINVNNHYEGSAPLTIDRLKALLD